MTEVEVGLGEVPCPYCGVTSGLCEVVERDELGADRDSGYNNGPSRFAHQRRVDFAAGAQWAAERVYAALPGVRG